MSINILPGDEETLNQMKGQKFVPHAGEGVVYVKLAFISPDTMENGDPAQAVEDAPGVILCGQLTKIRQQISDWFAEKQREYLDDTKKDQPKESKW